MIDLEKYAGKTLDSGMLAELSAAIAAHVEPLEARTQRAEEKARKAASESIEGRKGKDARIERMAELLGIDPDADLDKIEGVSGMAEARKQVEAKLRKYERDLADVTKQRDEISTRYATEKRERAIAAELAKHPFIDPEDAHALTSARVVQEGDELLFRLPDGKTSLLSDGVAWLAKTKPHLVKPASNGNGNGGSGFKGTNGTGDAGSKTIRQADFDALRPAERAKAMAEGYQLVDA